MLPHHVTPSLTLSHIISLCHTLSHFVSHHLTLSHPHSLCLTISHTVSHCYLTCSTNHRASRKGGVGVDRAASHAHHHLVGVWWGGGTHCTCCGCRGDRGFGCSTPGPAGLFLRLTLPCVGEGVSVSGVLSCVCHCESWVCGCAGGSRGKGMGRGGEGGSSGGGCMGAQGLRKRKEVVEHPAAVPLARGFKEWHACNATVICKHMKTFCSS
jgi:hypothetical protein